MVKSLAAAVRRRQQWSEALAQLRLPQQAQWQAHCAHRLHDGAGGGRTLEAFFEQIDALQGSADERGQDILGALVDYATEIAPDRD